MRRSFIFLASLAVGIPMAYGSWLLSATPSRADQARSNRRVLVAAHRGGASAAPENTLAAIRKSIALGADYVEVDVRTTADGVLALMHDRTVDRTTDGTGEVAKLSWSEMSRLNANASGRGGRQRIPTFEEAARLCRSRTGLYIDHKAASPSAVIAALDKAAFAGKAVVYGTPETLAEYRRIRPKLAIMPDHPDTADLMAKLAAELHPETFDGHLRDWTRDQVAQAHRLGAEVWMDVMGPTDTEQGWAHAIEMGADALQTDHPDRLIAYLRSRKLR